MLIHSMKTTSGESAVWPINHYYIDEMSNTQHFIQAETWACAMEKLAVCRQENYSYLSSKDATGSFVFDVMAD